MSSRILFFTCGGEAREGYRVRDVFHVEDTNQHVHELTVPHLVVEVVPAAVHGLLEQVQREKLAFWVTRLEACSKMLRCFFNA